MLHRTTKSRGASVPQQGSAEQLLPHRTHLAARNAGRARGWGAGPRAGSWDVKDVGTGAGMIFGWLGRVSAVISSSPCIFTFLSGEGNPGPTTPELPVSSSITPMTLVPLHLSFHSACSLGFCKKRTACTLKGSLLLPQKRPGWVFSLPSR